MTAVARTPSPSRGEGGEGRRKLPAADAIDAISLDLDDTLWTFMTELVVAEQAMHAWLRERAPSTAEL